MTHPLTSRFAHLRGAVQTGAAAGALLALALPATAQQDNARLHLNNVWSVAYYDAEGAPTDKLGAFDTVAFVRGKQDYVFQIACNPQTGTPYYKLNRIAPDLLQFAGDSFQPSIIVRYQGRDIFERDLIEVTYNEEGYYRGPVGEGFVDAMKGGNVMVISDPESDFFMTISLDGSRDALSELPCQ